jgi:hypothetical protein
MTHVRRTAMPFEPSAATDLLAGTVMPVVMAFSPFLPVVSNL